MITITGGKLTTWRRMAKMTVDRLVERDAREAPCRTHEIPLGQAISPQELPRVEGVPEESYRALAGRYGHGAHDVLALAAERGELAQPIVAGLPDLLAEAALAARLEQARSIGDVMLRRTRLGLLASRELTSPAGGGAARAGQEGRGCARARARVGSRSASAWSSQPFASEATAGGDRGPERQGSVPPAPGGGRTTPARERTRLHGQCGRQRACELGARPWLMGIVNASPDSFSDGGLHAAWRPRCSSRGICSRTGPTSWTSAASPPRPAGRPLPPSRRSQLVVPLVERVAGELGATCPSTPTSPPSRAPRSRRGPAVINDVSGLRDPELADVCAQHRRCAGADAHARRPAVRLQDPDLYDDVTGEVIAFLREQGAARDLARRRRPSSYLFDPGPDFAKTPAQTIRLLSQLDRLHELSGPLLMAVSRKDFVGALTGRAPRERGAGTLAALAHGVDHGAHIFRLHDVAAASDFLKVRAALEGTEAPGRDLALGDEIRYDRVAPGGR